MVSASPTRTFSRKRASSGFVDERTRIRTSCTGTSLHLQSAWVTLAYHKRYETKSWWSMRFSFFFQFIFNHVNYSDGSFLFAPISSSRKLCDCFIQTTSLERSSLAPITPFALPRGNASTVHLQQQVQQASYSTVPLKQCCSIISSISLFRGVNYNTGALFAV